MSVVIEQLRISDDGQRLYIDAHVNKASYFDNLNLSKITICTEDQVSESHPGTYGEDYIWQGNISGYTEVRPIYNEVQILSDQQLVNKVQPNGSWRIGYNISEYPHEDHYMSVAFSGKLEDADGYKLVAAQNDFIAGEDSIYASNVFFIINGEQKTEKGHTYWLFKDKNNVGNVGEVYFHLYKVVDNQNVYIPLTEASTDNNFLHFLYQVYVSPEVTDTREVHLMLTKSDFDEAYDNGLRSEPDVTKPVATKEFKGTDLSKNMFFVYFETAGTPDPCTPCDMDGMVLGVTFDYGALYNPAMNYTRQLADDCNIPSGFIDYILNVDALKLSLETEHYIPAIEYWKRLIGGGNAAYPYRSTKTCGCHG